MRYKLVGHKEMKRWERKIYDGDRKGRWNYKSGMRGWQENDDKT